MKKFRLPKWENVKLTIAVIITTLAFFSTLLLIMQAVNQPKIEKLTIPTDKYKTVLIYIPTEKKAIEGQVREYKVFTGSDLIEITLKDGDKNTYLVDISNVTFID